MNILRPIIYLTFIFIHQSVFSQTDGGHEHTGHKPKEVCVSMGIECANAATPYISKDGALWLTWTAGGAISVAKSVDLGHTFSERIEIANHQKSLDAGGDARPVITGDGENKIFIAYGFFKDNNWNAQINVSNSVDGGQSFSAVRSLITDSASQRFPSVAVDSNGHLILVWIDKRLIAKAKENGESKLGASIAYAWSDDYGQTFQGEKIANPNSCECCRIGVVSTSIGQAALAYRAIFPGGVRDHAVQLIEEKQAKVAKIHSISDDNWKTDVCPHQGPSIAVSKNHTLHAVWYTQGSRRQGIFYARSIDLGATFTVPTRLGQESLNETRPYVLAIDQKIWIVWKEFDGKEASIWGRFSKDDGIHWSSDQKITQSTGYSDHPLLIEKKGKALLSWLTRADGYQLLEMGEYQ
jgi:hypothetical protein